MMSNEDDVRLSGYYNVVNVDSTEDEDYGHCTLVEIKNNDNETIQIGFYYNLDHACVEKVSVLKKGHHY